MLKKHRANVAQLVEQLIRNQQVSGSSPLVGSSDFKGLERLILSNPFLLVTKFPIRFFFKSLE